MGFPLFKKVLAIETSCDDTSVSIVGAEGWVHQLVSAAQDQDHAVFGGIVPEIASRNHSFYLLPLIEKIIKPEEWSEIDGIVVTNRPGLVGSLIVGIVTAKTLAQTKGIPFLGVNHLEGHLLAPFLKDAQYQPHFSHEDKPFIALAVSGGHTSLYHVQGLGDYRILGATRDDAAGEAFDKFAKNIGLGFPGGPKVDQWAKSGNVSAFSFPRGLMKEDTYDMSFSGLKSAAQRELETKSASEIQTQLPDLCASFQSAVCEVLVHKLDRAVNLTRLAHVVVTGGVSANSGLRSWVQSWADRKGVQLLIPPLRYCTDNAAMIGYAGILRMNRGERSHWEMGPSPRSLPGDFHVSHQ